MSEKTEQNKLNKLNSDENELKSKGLDWEAKQNAVGFFSLLLKVAKRNPKIWKQICNENNKNKENL